LHARLNGQRVIDGHADLGNVVADFRAGHGSEHPAVRADGTKPYRCVRGQIHYVRPRFLVAYAEPEPWFARFSALMLHSVVAIPPFAHIAPTGACWSLAIRASRQND